MSDNPFVLPKDAYKRDIDPIRHAVDQYAFYLAKQTGQSYEDARRFVVEQFKKGGRFEFQDPEVKYLKRGENGDRTQETTTLRRYIYDSINEQELIAPTFTTYLPHHVKESYLVPYITNNVKARSAAKKQKFEYEQDGNVVMMDIKDNEQATRKIKNNSISGAHLSPSTPLFNKTSHSTLTSNCRTTSGYGNANNEKLLSGNRHYWCAELVRSNLTSIVQRNDYGLIEQVMQRYGLVYPSVDDVMDCIEYSTRLYWRDATAIEDIRRYVNCLTALERAAFVYVGDLYHIRKHNPEFIRTFLMQLSARQSGELIENHMPILKSLPEDNINLAAQLCPDDCKGKKQKDLDPRAAGNLIATARHVGAAMQQYADFIEAFLRTEHVPASLAKFPDSIRRSALTSDTDSTIFTVQEWVLWAHGRYGFTDDCMATAAAVVYISSQNIIHVLARMSANFGIPTARIHQVGMKNEFKFDVFVPTQVAKHYFALISCQEGNLFEKYKEEIKGVHLRSSNVARDLIEDAKRLMREVMDTIMREEKIKIVPILKHIADKEREITAAIYAANTRFFKRAQVKDVESYTKREQEPTWQGYLMWRDVFAPKYGDIAPPPYTALRLSSDIDSKGDMELYLDELEDLELVARMREFMARHNRKYIGTFYLPDVIASSNRIPEELIKTVGHRSIIRDGMKAHYLVLECLGIYFETKKNTKLVSDYY